MGEITATAKKSKERIQLVLPTIEGDMQIYLMQSVVLLIKANQSLAYSESVNKGFTIEMILGLLKELNISV